jgi:hypothetical protein
MKTRILAWTAVLVGTVGPQVAMAQTAMPPDTAAPAVDPYNQGTAPGMQTTPVPDDRSYNYTVPEYQYGVRSKPSFIRTPGGMSVEGGGGVIGFTNSDLRDVTKVGGGYNVRLTYGTRSPIAVEAAYIGSTQAIDALGLDHNALLMSNGAEGLLRANLSTGAWQPFVAAGVAWRHYNIRSDVNTSNVKDNDNVVEIPAALGLGWRNRGFLLDARAGYRQSFSNELLGTANLSSWNGNINLGVEF